MLSTTFKPTMMQRTRLLATGHPIHALSAAVPTLGYYGGATVTRAHDAVGKLFTVCCAKNLELNAFGLFSIKDGIAQWIAPVVSGRGSIWVSLFNGTASWVGFDGSAPPQGGPIPDFVPFKFGGDTAALEAQITALTSRVSTLEQTIAHLPPTTTGPLIRVPAAGGKEGGEIQLAATDGGGPWSIDVTGGVLRFHRNGVVVERWPKV